MDIEASQQEPIVGESIKMAVAKSREEVGMRCEVGRMEEEEVEAAAPSTFRTHKRNNQVFARPSHILTDNAMGGDERARGPPPPLDGTTGD